LIDKKVVTSSELPKPQGPYSPGIVSNGFVFTAGQGAMDSKTNTWRGGDIKQQTKVTMDNVKAILEAAGSSIDKVVKVNIFLKDKKLFGEMNEVYATYFSKDPPARSTVITDLLRDDMLIEIETVAIV
jgi:2-iminobutanoate/2-iminopropanoate deaminase